MDKFSRTGAIPSSSLSSDGNHVNEENGAWKPIQKRTGNYATDMVAEGREDTSKDDILFPARLHYILGELERDGLDWIMSWCNKGAAFVVHDRDKLQEMVLQRWFRQGSFQSFKRQLSNYGFKRIYDGSANEKQEGPYMHEMFLRDQPSFSTQITFARKRQKSKQAPGEESSRKNYSQEGVPLQPRPLPSQELPGSKDATDVARSSVRENLERASAEESCVPKMYATSGGVDNFRGSCFVNHGIDTTLEMDRKPSPKTLLSAPIENSSSTTTHGKEDDSGTNSERYGARASAEHTHLVDRKPSTKPNLASDHGSSTDTRPAALPDDVIDALATLQRWLLQPQRPSSANSEPLVTGQAAIRDNFSVSVASNGRSTNALNEFGGAYPDNLGPNVPSAITFHTNPSGYSNPVSHIAEPLPNIHSHVALSLRNTTPAATLEDVLDFMHGTNAQLFEELLYLFTSVPRYANAQGASAAASAATTSRQLHPGLTYLPAPATTQGGYAVPLINTPSITNFVRASMREVRNDLPSQDLQYSSSKANTISDYVSVARRDNSNADSYLKELLAISETQSQQITANMQQSSPQDQPGQPPQLG